MQKSTRFSMPDMRVVFAPSGTIGTKIETLSELFTEWFLFDSETTNTIDTFIENNGLSDILTASDFTDLICGNAYLCEALITLIPLLLPFKITEQKMQRLNNAVAAHNVRMVCPNPIKIYTLAQGILHERADNRTAVIRNYKKEYRQIPEVRER